jgi:hypothetical protein
MLQPLGSRALQRTATEQSRGQRTTTEQARGQRTATEHSPARNCALDPDLRLQKSTTPDPFRIKTYHGRTPDVGIGILISMPSYRTGNLHAMPSYNLESHEMIEYYGECLGHGQSKTAFELHCPGARFHCKVLKVAEAKDMEPSVFFGGSPKPFDNNHIIQLSWRR